MIQVINLMMHFAMMTTAMVVFLISRTTWLLPSILPRSLQTRSLKMVCWSERGISTMKLSFEMNNSGWCNYWLIVHNGFNNFLAAVQYAAFHRFTIASSWRNSSRNAATCYRIACPSSSWTGPSKETHFSAVAISPSMEVLDSWSQKQGKAGFLVFFSIWLPSHYWLIRIYSNPSKDGKAKSHSKSDIFFIHRKGVSILAFFVNPTQIAIYIYTYIHIINMYVCIYIYCIYIYISLMYVFLCIYIYDIYI